MQNFIFFNIAFGRNVLKLIPLTMTEMSNYSFASAIVGF